MAGGASGWYGGTGEAEWQWTRVAGKQQRGRWLLTALPPSLPSRPVSLRPPTSPLCCSVWREVLADVNPELWVEIITD